MKLDGAAEKHHIAHAGGREAHVQCLPVQFRINWHWCAFSFTGAFGW